MEGTERAKKREEIRRVLWCTLALFSDGGGGGGHCAKFPSPFPPSLPPDFAPLRDWLLHVPTPALFSTTHVCTHSSSLLIQDHCDGGGDRI